MGVWTYRVIRNKNNEYYIAEVYRFMSGEDRPYWTQTPASPMGMSVEELKQDLRRMEAALMKPVLIEGETLLREEISE